MREHGDDNTKMTGGVEHPGRLKSPKHHSTKRSPQRTCVVCHEVQNKQDLIRLIKIGDSHLEIDNSGRRAGRGMYICRKQKCWEKALEDKWLNRTLQIKISPENYTYLREQSRNFISYSR